ncbi:MAG: hypothetical protein AB7O31_12350 [Burkholderiales bacterium]
MAALLIMGGSWFLVSTMGSAAELRAAERAHNARVLAEAKAALIGWIAMEAMSDASPGRLPCPQAWADVGSANEGRAAGNCASAVGWVPWRTLGIAKPLDASGAQLWYVVSPGWHLPSSAASLTINSNTNGQLTVDGASAVAVIIAPGSPLQVQPNANQLAAGCVARTQSSAINLPGTSPDPLDFLDCENGSTGNNVFTRMVVDNASNPVFNDQLVVVTAAEVMAAIEGPVRVRIENEVLPQIESIYASSQWGATASTPIFPFPARFADDAGATFNPEDFRGRRYRDDANSILHTQGLLPLTRSQGCTTGDRCDPAFVYWHTAWSTIENVQPIAISKASGGATLNSWDCSTSTSTLLTCSIAFRETCAAWTTCTPDIRVRIDASAPNVGMTLKDLTTAGTTGGAAPSLTAPIQADGSARASYLGSLTGTAAFCWFSSCTAYGNRTVTIPISVFADHAFLNPAVTDAWYWFFANNWHQVTFYAVAPSHLPSGATHDCSAVGDCLSVTGLTPASGNRALIALAGQSLTRSARPNGTLADFLDVTENQNWDQVFEQRSTGRAFNDRFISLSSY